MHARRIGTSTRRFSPTRALAARAALALWLLACSPAAPASAPAKPAAAPPAASAPAAPAPVATAPPAPAKISVTYSSKSANQAPLWLAAERGYFTQHGIDAELVFLSSTLSGQGLIANSVQFGLIGAEGIDLNLEAGSPVSKYVAGVTPKLVFKAVAQPDIRAVEDLRGRTVAASRKGSVSDYAWRKLLERHGMQLDRDVTITYPGTTDGALAALVAGHIQATVSAPPADLQAAKQGMVVLADITAMDIPYLMGGVIVRTDYAAANPDVVERYLRAHLQGVHTNLTDVESTLTVLGKYLETDDREALRSGYDTFLPSMTRDQLMPEAAIVATLQESPRANARDANPRDFYDNSYLQRIHATGYTDRLYAGR
jgi:NitT/TauT family transport system substrate-binding protein